MAYQLLAAALPIIGRVAAGAVSRGVASGAISEGTAGALGTAGRVVGKAGPMIGGGNHGNEGETRNGNFSAGADAQPRDAMSSAWLNVPQW